jgi:hypothetical protein
MRIEKPPYTLKLGGMLAAAVIAIFTWGLFPWFVSDAGYLGQKSHPASAG